MVCANLDLVIGRNAISNMCLNTKYCSPHISRPRISSDTDISVEGSENRVKEMPLRLGTERGSMFVA